MYSEKIKAIKYQPKLKKRLTILGDREFTKERMKQVISGFCTKEDIEYAEQTKLLDLFDEYCKENGYPLFDRKSTGFLLKEIFDVSSRVVRIDGKVKRIYVINDRR